ncbi:MAG TPA: hypothetical protein VNJ03_01900 [Vicinamibacterales bacterium]|nr:hypothetical protein [Vicinamibacterales bacterium]
MRKGTFAIALAALAISAACGSDSKSPTTPPTPTPTPTPVATLTAPAPETPSANQQLDTLRPTLTVRNATSTVVGTRTYEFQISDTTAFTSALTSNITGFAATISQGGIAEGSGGTTSFTPSTDLQPTTVFFWRARAVQGTVNGPWSEPARFRTKLVGFLRAGELYDPLVHGETVGERVGSTTFIAGKGLRLDNGLSFVRYRLPQTITAGEFSMDVEGLRANGPGDKAKVFGMQEGDTDFITNRYRIDIQYRGTAGFPPNAIQWRVIYGNADDLSVRYEPDTAKRNASVFLLNPSTTYHWKFTWGSSVNLTMIENGLGGNTLYNFGLPAPRGTYSPNPHVAYLGAPLGRSGTESASIPGTIYRNVWLSNRPRPATLGSALEIK